jgi:hypothetical protein
MSKLKYLNVNHEYEGRTQKQKNPYPEDSFAPAAAAPKSPTPQPNSPLFYAILPLLQHISSRTQLYFLVRLMLTTFVVQ